MVGGKSHSPISVAVRCPACGRRSYVDGLCSACGDVSLEKPRQITQIEPATGALGSSSRAVLLPQTAALQQFAPPSPVRRSPPVIMEDWSWFVSSELRGRILIVKAGSQEPMDFDAWRWVAIPVWGVILLLTPLVFAIIVWQSIGFLPALGVAACSIFVLRFMFSDRLLQSWQFTAALNGKYIVEPMPVVMIRLRLPDDREVQLRLKGRLSGGDVMEGDRISASGKWRGGVFRVQQISCERTGASIIPRQPNARSLATVGLCILTICSLWLYFAGIPWVTCQYRAFQSSIQKRAPQFQNYEFQR